MGGDIRKFSQLFADINVNYSVDRITNNLSEIIEPLLTCHLSYKASFSWSQALKGDLLIQV
jgi:hypothetical protein